MNEVFVCLPDGIPFPFGKKNFVTHYQGFRRNTALEMQKPIGNYRILSIAESLEH
ncbi:hypothetical protein [Leptospira sp. GIMC2001]|uniref:hypothetical protein n=1 Tax=Leptospira sp. GIMC2001 TaxID=1513297 RepID=UPI002349A279|nr:hypothetical protein [Leptospira sp. GIMC2001]WCL47686.1 hypothetical protein O4O04_00075 [Leptospira sp. GIMC2001]